MNRGYIKIWRKIEDSGLYQMPNTLALFMFILTKAMYKDCKVGTSSGVIELKRGQYISGRLKLASELEQSEQQIRTSLERLSSLKIITSTATNKFSIYTIVNYGQYQDDISLSNQQNNQQTTSAATNKQPTDNQQTTTKEESKESKESKEVKNKDLSAPKVAVVMPDGVDPQVWIDWLQLRKTKKAVVSKTVLDGAMLEAGKAGMSLNEFLKVWCLRGSQGLEASWLKQTNNKPPKLDSFADRNYGEGGLL